MKSTLPPPPKKPVPIPPKCEYNKRLNERNKYDPFIDALMNNKLDNQIDDSFVDNFLPTQDNLHHTFFIPTPK